MFRFSFHNLAGFCGHNAVKLVILREVVHEWQDHVPEKYKPLPGAGIADVRRLLVGDVQALTEYLAVAAGLVQQIDEIAVFKDVLDLCGGQQVLDILGNTRRDTAPFTKAFPNLHAPGAYLAPQQQVELVHIVSCGLALVPVDGDTVPHLILDDQHPQVFELLA